MRREGPLVSVCVASYNNACYLSACLASILTQTLTDLEVVVVDDDSNDASMDVLDRVQDPRLRVHRNRVNRGVAHVRNRLLELSAGRYVSFLDADDIYYTRNKLERELATIDRHRKDETPIAFSDIMLIDAYGQELHQVSTRKRLAEGDLYESILERSIMIPRDYLCTKQQVLTVGGYDESLPIYEDWDLKIRLAHRFAFVFSGVIGIGYRRHGSGLSATADDVQAHWISVVRSRYAA